VRIVSTCDLTDLTDLLMVTSRAYFTMQLPGVKSGCRSAAVTENEAGLRPESWIVLIPIIVSRATLIEPDGWKV
jgi:hypothetical protein